MRDGAGALLAKRVIIRQAGARSPPFWCGELLFGISWTLWLDRQAVCGARGEFQVILENCRGVGGRKVCSAFFDEQNDGEDTVNWLTGQAWFDGNLALWGVSYLGNTAWAIANSAAAAKVKAMGLHVTLSNFHDRTYAFGGFTLQGSIGWTSTMAEVALSKGGISFSGSRGCAECGGWRRRRWRCCRSRMRIRWFSAGSRVWQNWMNHAEPGDGYWSPIDYGRAAESLRPR